MNLESKIESILFFKNEPVSLSELGKLLEASKGEVESAVRSLLDFYKNRGIILVFDGDEVSLGTSPETSALIERIQKEEFSRELGRAGLEVLAIVIYKGQVSRREIDHIRGVNSGFTVRSLLVRGLIERTDPLGTGEGSRSHFYKPTLELMRFLGVGRLEDLPNYQSAFEKLEEFKNLPTEENE